MGKHTEQRTEKVHVFCAFLVHGLTCLKLLALVDLVVSPSGRKTLITLGGEVGGRATALPAVAAGQKLLQPCSEKAKRRLCCFPTATSCGWVVSTRGASEN